MQQLQYLPWLFVLGQGGGMQEEPKQIFYKDLDATSPSSPPTSSEASAQPHRTRRHSHSFFFLSSLLGAHQNDIGMLSCTILGQWLCQPPEPFLLRHHLRLEFINNSRLLPRLPPSLLDFLDRALWAR
jgi:hypothetical protein